MERRIRRTGKTILLLERFLFYIGDRPVNQCFHSSGRRLSRGLWDKEPSTWRPEGIVRKVRGKICQRKRQGDLPTQQTFWKSAFFSE
jgi:hypothetical protein